MLLDIVTEKNKNKSVIILRIVRFTKGSILVPKVISKLEMKT